MRTTLRRRPLAVVAAAAAVTGLLAAVPTAAEAAVPTTDADIVTTTGTCSWTVKGNIVVDMPTVAGLADNDPVDGVKVKVSGRSSLGTFNEWGTAVTTADGFFSVTKSECNNRAVRVEVQFESDDLKTTSSKSKTWYEVFNTGSTIAPSTINLNREPMGAGGGDQALAQARTDAQTWIVYRTALDYVAELGFPFTKKVTVHNAATLTSGASAADPILQDIHIDPGHTASIDAMLHELGHVWLYQHGTGEGCLTFDALLSGDTHGQVESECVAFNEGTAEFFSNKLRHELDDAGLLPSAPSTTTLKPRNRAQLAQVFGADTLPEVGTNDDAWDHVNRVLFATDVTRWTFGTATGLPGFAATYVGPACTGKPVGQDDLADLLTVIGSDMDYSTVTVSGYLQRAADKLVTMDPVDKSNIQETVNPSKTSEPHTLYGC